MLAAFGVDLPRSSELKQLKSENRQSSKNQSELQGKERTERKASNFSLLLSHGITLTIGRLFPPSLPKQEAPGCWSWERRAIPSPAWTAFLDQVESLDWVMPWESSWPRFVQCRRRMDGREWASVLVLFFSAAISFFWHTIRNQTWVNSLHTKDWWPLLEKEAWYEPRPKFTPEERPNGIRPCGLVYTSSCPCWERLCLSCWPISLSFLWRRLLDLFSCWERIRAWGPFSCLFS